MPSESRPPRPLMEEIRDLYQQLETVVPKGHKEKAQLLRDCLDIRERVEHLLNEYEDKVIKNEMLSTKLEEVKPRIEKLRKRVDALTKPPTSVATFLELTSDTTALISITGRKMEINIDEGVDYKSLRTGQEINLNEAFVLVKAGSQERSGEIGVVDSIIDDTRIRVTMRHDEKIVCERGATIRQKTISVGDEVLVDTKTHLALEVLEKSEHRELWLEEIEDVSYQQLGGLQKQILQIREEVEYPFLYPELFKDYHLELSKGILLYGPPGCGKTLLAKAMASNIIHKRSEEMKKDVKGYFMNIKGPEILNKYVGESERKIREIFQEAQKRANDTTLVVIFIDEADSILRTRGTAISSDVNNTIVPQFLSELDGVKTVKNVLTVLATNRQELIDPAVLRPGRIDRKIFIHRPNREEVREIFEIYLKQKPIPIHRKYVDSKHEKYDPKYKVFEDNHSKAIDYIIEQAISRLWATQDDYSYMNAKLERIRVNNSLLEVTFASGVKSILYLRDFISGALIKNIVDRAKRGVVLRIISLTKEKQISFKEAREAEGGINARDLCVAIEAELSEAEDSLNIGENLQQWLDVQGYHQRVMHARSLVAERRKEIEEQRKVEAVTTGHYF